MIVFLGLSILCALAGAWLLFDFFLWFFTGTVVPSTIESFEKEKPVLVFETKEGKQVKQRAERIMQMGYYLASPQPGDIFNAIYREGMEVQVRVHGYMYLVVGVLLFFPLLGYVAVELGKSWLGGQVSFAATFAVVVTGAWVLLKMVRRNY